MKSAWVIIVLIAIVTAPTIHATSTPATYCERPDVKTIELPIYPGQKASPTFQYKFQVYNGGTDQSPTVIFLPGGPGETSITDAPDKSPTIPTGFNAIFTDQRAVGCNDLTAQGFPENGYQTRYYAEDVIGIIRALRLKNYIIYGHSFGTAHATVTASLIDQHKKAGEEIELPNAVILEGVIGRAFRRDEATHAYQAEWRKVVDRLSSSAQKAITANDVPFNDLENAAGKWGYFIQTQSYLGRFPLNTALGPTVPNLDLTVEQLVSGDPAKVNALKAMVNRSVFTDWGYTFKVLGCREIFANFPGKFILAQGEMVAVGNYCDGLNFDRPFDSKDWSMSVPIYYFQGTNDSATPLWQANYHFAENQSGPKTFITVGESGHMPLAFSMYAAGCKKTILTSILNNGVGIQAAISSCNWKWPITIGTK